MLFDVVVDTISILIMVDLWRLSTFLMVGKTIIKRLGGQKGFLTEPNN